mmetsp:Transcript_55095/g.103302  ORF Transcript_55095/g.103302 Transcript_55095/m.103302 type:complete len:80 (+) Transcript_55095:117-356(+)
MDTLHLLGFRWSSKTLFAVSGTKSIKYRLSTATAAITRKKLSQVPVNDSNISKISGPNMAAIRPEAKQIPQPNVLASAG